MEKTCIYNRAANNSESSLENQRKECKIHAENQGLEIVKALRYKCEKREVKYGLQNIE